MTQRIGRYRRQADNGRAVVSLKLFVLFSSGRPPKKGSLFCPFAPHGRLKWIESLATTICQSFRAVFTPTLLGHSVPFGWYEAGTRVGFLVFGALASTWVYGDGKSFLLFSFC